MTCKKIVIFLKKYFFEPFFSLSENIVENIFHYQLVSYGGEF
jgi:hypothetical protein